MLSNDNRIAFGIKELPNPVSACVSYPHRFHAFFAHTSCSVHTASASSIAHKYTFRLSDVLAKVHDHNVTRDLIGDYVSSIQLSFQYVSYVQAHETECVHTFRCSTAIVIFFLCRSTVHFRLSSTSHPFQLSIERAN